MAALVRGSLTAAWKNFAKVKDGGGLWWRWWRRIEVLVMVKVVHS